jgi:hypothetical protein
MVNFSSSIEPLGSTIIELDICPVTSVMTFYHCHIHNGLGLS